MHHVTLMFLSTVFTQPGQLNASPTDAGGLPSPSYIDGIYIFESGGHATHRGLYFVRMCCMGAGLGAVYHKNSSGKTEGGCWSGNYRGDRHVLGGPG